MVTGFQQRHSAQRRTAVCRRVPAEHGLPYDPLLVEDGEWDGLVGDVVDRGLRVGGAEVVRMSRPVSRIDVAKTTAGSSTSASSRSSQAAWVSSASAIAASSSSALDEKWL
jgi:hypothetical protein